LSSQSSRSCAGSNIKVLKDKGLEFANSIRPFAAHETRGAILPALRAQKLSTEMNVELVVGQEVFGRHADRMVALRLRYECDHFSPPCGTCTVDTHL
jgi:DNA-binding transcriptional ArsR family regulator